MPPRIIFFFLAADLTMPPPIIFYLAMPPRIIFFLAMPPLAAVIVFFAGVFFWTK
jgi:hypothetical protein